MEKPLEYYENNICGTLNLCYVMREFECKSIVFSSSATVYGRPKECANKTRIFPLEGLQTPYGRSKAISFEGRFFRRTLLPFQELGKAWEEIG